MSIFLLLRFLCHALKRDPGRPKVAPWWIVSSSLWTGARYQNIDHGWTLGFVTSPTSLGFKCYRKGKTAPAKKWPHMTLIEPSVKDNQLQLDYPGMDSLTIKLPEGKVLDEMERVKVAVWGDPCLGVDLGDQVILQCNPEP